MKYLQTFLYSFVFISLAQAQPVGAGLKIGVPFNQMFQNQPNPNLDVGVPSASSNSYTIGAYVEVRLPLNLSIEGDALYRGLQVSAVTVGASTIRYRGPPANGIFRSLPNTNS